jgi:hypothetical protein
MWGHLPTSLDDLNTDIFTANIDPRSKMIGPVYSYWPDAESVFWRHLHRDWSFSWQTFSEFIFPIHRVYYFRYPAIFDAVVGIGRLNSWLPLAISSLLCSKRESLECPINSAIVTVSSTVNFTAFQGNNFSPSLEVRVAQGAHSGVTRRVSTSWYLNAEWWSLIEVFVGPVAQSM